MLTTITAKPTATEDDGEGWVRFADLLVAFGYSLLDISKKLNRVKTYPPADLTQAHLYDSLKRETFIFVFAYERNNEYYTFRLPLYYNLPKRPIKHNRPSQENLKPIKARNRSFISLFIAIIYHPLSMAASGLISIANLFNLLPLPKIHLALPKQLRQMEFPAKLTLLASSITYFGILGAYFFGKDKLIKELHTIFNNVRIDIEEKNYKDAKYKLTNLSRMHKLLLHPNFPNNLSIRWRYYYLRGLLSQQYDDKNELVHYDEALSCAISPNQKLLTLRGIINSYDEGLMYSIHQYEMCKVEGSCEQNALNKAETIKNSKKWTMPYIEQIPTDATLYRILADKLYAQFEACLTSFRENNFEQGYKQFYQIKWDGFSKHAYPWAVIMYYQLESIVILFTNRKEIPGPREFTQRQSLEVVSKNANIIQACIDTYYPEKSEEYKQYIDGFEQAFYEMDNAFVSPEKRFTPLAENQKRSMETPKSTVTITEIPDATNNTSLNAHAPRV